MSYLEQYEDEIYACTTLRCGGCGVSCPGFVAAGFEANTPRGRLRIARELLEHNVAAINEAAASLGVTRMTTSCPGCAAWFKLYPARFGLSLNVEVLHTTELFDQLIRDGRLGFKEWDTTCLYHDACALGRRLGVYEEPRECLKAIPGVRLIEAETNRDLAACCGSVPWYSGAQPPGTRANASHVRQVHRITRQRVQEIEETGADTVVAACTGCARVLGGMMKGSRSQTEVLLISDALARNLVSRA